MFSLDCRSSEEILNYSLIFMFKCVYNPLSGKLIIHAKGIVLISIFPIYCLSFSPKLPLQLCSTLSMQSCVLGIIMIFFSHSVLFLWKHRQDCNPLFSVSCDYIEGPLPEPWWRLLMLFSVGDSQMLFGVGDWKTESITWLFALCVTYGWLVLGKGVRNS